MSAQERFWAVALLIILGSYGWGHVTFRVLDRGSSVGSLRRESTPPMVVCVGLALFVAVGGFAVMAGIAYFSLMATWFAVGAVLALRPLLRGLGRVRLWQPSPRGALFAAVAAVVIALVVALAYGAAVNGPSNPNDDAAAYLYLAERLLRTGGMIDPFNFRRITSYDSGELFQAMFLRAAGTSAGMGVEWFLFGLLTAALFVGRIGRRYALPSLLIAGVVVAVIHPVGATVNVAPTFSGVALTFALLRLLAVPAVDHDARRYALVGLFVGALLSLRYAFAIPAAVAVVAAAFAAAGPRVAIRRVGMAVVVAATSVTGWAIALAKSSGTPLYPLISGNASMAGRWRNPAVHTVGAYLARVGHEIATDGWGFEIALALIATGLVACSAHRKIGGRQLTEEVVLLLGAIGGCVVLLAITTYALSGGSYSGIGRYNAPSALAVLLCAIDLLWRDAATLRVLVRPRLPARALIACSAAVVAVTSTPLPSGATAPSPRPVRRVVESAQVDLSAARRALFDDDAFSDQWALYRSRYQQISDDVPAGAKILAAVDLPGLLDFSRFQFATLDEVGAASPPPHVPLNSGPAALIAYLERLGYSGIVASTTEARGLYFYPQWQTDLGSNVYDYRVLAAGFVTWSTMLSELSHDKAVRVARAPTLVYYAFSP